jgi:hypothetical protein
MPALWSGGDLSSILGFVSEVGAMLFILWVTANAKKAAKTLRKVMNMNVPLMSWSTVIASGVVVCSPPTREQESS